MIFFVAYLPGFLLQQPGILPWKVFSYMAQYGGVHKWGISNSWMVYFMENPNLKWMICPYFRKPPYGSKMFKV